MDMTRKVAIAVVGAGLVGRRHAALIAASEGVRLAAIVDPEPAGRGVAEALGAPGFDSLEAMLAEMRPDGLVIATPNTLHAPQGLAAIAARTPVLIEKPLADEVSAAERLTAAAEAAGVPVLVGHHRRHNPLIAEAKAAIDAGRLGRLVAAHAVFWLYKPDDYFEIAWRREAGAGPVFINLSHDVDLLRHLCGEIDAVTALESSAARGHAVEDTACALLRFANGALGTLTASDAIVAPWSWELGSGENPAYPPAGQNCYQIGGTHGALSLPAGEIWSAADARSWWRPIRAERVVAPPEDPLARQLAHFRRVILGEEAPLVSAREGLETLRAIEALKTSAAAGREVRLR